MPRASLRHRFIGARSVKNAKNQIRTGAGEFECIKITPTLSFPAPFDAVPEREHR